MWHMLHISHSSSHSHNSMKKFIIITLSLHTRKLRLRDVMEFAQELSSGDKNEPRVIVSEAHGLSTLACCSHEFFNPQVKF